MAPPKTPRNKKKSDANTSQPVAPNMGGDAKGSHPEGSSRAPQLPEALAKVQEDEREVLKAIFMDDYEEVEAKGAWSVCCCPSVNAQPGFDATSRELNLKA